MAVIWNGPGPAVPPFRSGGHWEEPNPLSMDDGASYWRCYFCHRKGVGPLLKCPMCGGMVAEFCAADGRPLAATYVRHHARPRAGLPGATYLYRLTWLLVITLVLIFAYAIGKALINA